MLTNGTRDIGVRYVLPLQPAIHMCCKPHDTQGALFGENLSGIEHLVGLTTRCDDLFRKSQGLRDVNIIHHCRNALQQAASAAAKSRGVVSPPADPSRAHLGYQDFLFTF